MITFYARCITMDGRTQYTVEIPNKDTFKVPEAEEIDTGKYVPVHTGHAGETAVYIAAESQEMALEWVKEHFSK